MNKRSIIAIILILIIGATATIWHFYGRPDSSEHSNFKHAEVIDIGLTPWTGYLPLYVAREMGYFEEEGVHVNLISYNDIEQQLNDLKSEKIDGGGFLNLEIVREALFGFQSKIVLIMDTSNGADAIVTSANINTVADMKGKRVAYDIDTFEELFLHWALERSDLSLDDITAIDAGPDVSPSLMQSGEADVAVTYEPYLSELTNDPSQKYHTIYSTADAPGLIIDMLVMQKELTEEYPETVQALVNAYFKGVAYWKENPKKAHAIVAKEFGEGETAQSIAEQLEGIIIYNKEANQRMFTFSQELNSIYGNLTQTEDFLRTQMLKKNKEVTKLDLSTLIDSRFIQ